MEEKTNTLEEAIIDLFINVKIRDPEEVSLIKVENFTKEQFEKERKKLKKKDPLKIIEDIKCCFEAIMNMNQDSDKSLSQRSCNRMSFSKVPDSPIEQEKLMQKLESEIRSHISVFLN